MQLHNMISVVSHPVVVNIRNRINLSWILLLTATLRHFDRISAKGQLPDEIEKLQSIAKFEFKIYSISDINYKIVYFMSPLFIIEVTV